MDSDFQEIKNLNGFTTGSFPVRYLGTPLVYGKAKSCHFIPLIERIASFINTWSSHSLSYVGCLELLKVVTQGVESFWIQNFPLPFAIIDKIDKFCRNFLCGGARAKIAWADICTPKCEEGLGLKDCKTWNKAMLFRVLWDIHSNKNSLWIRWIHAVYLRGKDIWTWSHGRDDHPLFKNL